MKEDSKENFICCENVKSKGVESNFQEIKLDFGNIEEIKKNTEEQFDKILQGYASEISELISIYDVNQILCEPNYISSKMMKKIKKILDFEEFKFNFKLDKNIDKKNKKKEENKIEIKEGSNKNKKFVIKQDNKNDQSINKENSNKKGNGKESHENVDIKSQELNEIDNEVKAGKKQNKDEKKDNEKIKIEDKEKKKEDIKEKEKSENRINIKDKENETNNEKNHNKDEDIKKRENIQIINKESKDELNLNEKSKENINEENIKSNSAIVLSPNLSNTDTSKSSSTQLSIITDEPKKKNIDFLVLKIMKELNSIDEEILHCKDYESNVRKNMKVFLDFCSEQDLKIETRSGCSIKFIYKLYEKLIQKDINKKDKRIIEDKNKVSTVEFDIMIKNVKKSTIDNFLEKYKENIICKGNLDNLDEKENYQIIGEVAKDILNQSPDKIKQIIKYLDIIIINDILRKEKIEGINYIKQSFQSINFNYDDKKIIMIISDGSYIKLLKAYNMIENEIDINKLLNDREKLNIKSFKRIINLLNDSKIPYIIFFNPSDIKNQIDDFIIEHMKSKENVDDNLKKKLKTLNKNIYISYYVKPFDKVIDDFKNAIIEFIFQRVSIYDFNLTCKNLYDEIIEELKQLDFTFELIVLQDNDIVSAIKQFLHQYQFIKYNDKYIKGDSEMMEYINKNNKLDDNVFRCLIYEKKENEFQFEIEMGNYFSSIISNKHFSNDFDKFKESFKNKIKYYFSDKLKNFVKNNFLYYTTDKEHLNRKNLKNKIMYDLDKLNFLNYKKSKKINDENNYVKYAEEIINILNSLDLTANIQNLYEQKFDENNKNILKLNVEHFARINYNKNEVLEEYLCWAIYRFFFCDYLLRKVYERIN